MMSVEQEAVNYDQVRIPIELYNQLSDFFSNLKMSILREAVRQVAEHSPENDRSVLQLQDVITAGREAIRDAASDFEQSFRSSNELNHAERRAS